LGCLKLSYYEQETERNAFTMYSINSKLTLKNTAENARSYLVFGALMPGRSFNAGSYRYGFNGQEKTNELVGSNNHYTAPFWEYNPRVVHRWQLDPRPNSSFSPYAIMQGNPIMFSDPMGDSVRSNQEGFNDINNALNLSLDNRSPFGFDQKNEVLTFDGNFDRKSFSGKQLELIDRFAASVTSKNHDATVVKVGTDDPIADLGGGTLRNIEATGFTQTTFFREEKTRFITSSTTNIYYSGNPVIKIDGEFQNAKSWYVGLTLLHEIGGHLYENITNLYLSRDFRNINVERFEKNVIREIFKHDGISPVGGDEVKHPRSEEFKDFKHRIDQLSK